MRYFLNREDWIILLYILYIYYNAYYSFYGVYILEHTKRANLLLFSCFFGKRDTDLSQSLVSTAASVKHSNCLSGGKTFWNQEVSLFFHGCYS